MHPVAKRKRKNSIQKNCKGPEEEWKNGYQQLQWDVQSYEDLAQQDTPTGAILV